MECCPTPAGDWPDEQEQRRAGARRQARVAELDSAVGELAGHLHAATGRLLELVASFGELQGWVDHGAMSPAQWLSWRCGISPAAAADYVRVWPGA